MLLTKANHLSDDLVMKQNYDLYPKLGAKINYIRYDGKQFLEGDGFVKAIFIDPNGYPSVQVADAANEKSVFNVELACADAPEDFKVRYKNTIELIDAKAKEGNEKAQEVVRSYNQSVDELRAIAFGDPIVISYEVENDGEEAKG
jgi:hypothetical protein